MMMWFVRCFSQRAWCSGRGSFGSTSGEAVELGKSEAGRYMMQHVVVCVLRVGCGVHVCVCGVCRACAHDACVVA